MSPPRGRQRILLSRCRRACVHIGLPTLLTSLTTGIGRQSVLSITAAGHGVDRHRGHCHLPVVGVALLPSPTPPGIRFPNGGWGLRHRGSPLSPCSCAAANICPMATTTLTRNAVSRKSSSRRPASQRRGQAEPRARRSSREQRLRRIPREGDRRGDQRLNQQRQAEKARNRPQDPAQTGAAAASGTSRLRRLIRQRDKRWHLDGKSAAAA